MTTYADDPSAGHVTAFRDTGIGAPRRGPWRACTPWTRAVRPLSGRRAGTSTSPRDSPLLPRARLCCR